MQYIEIDVDEHKMCFDILLTLKVNVQRNFDDEKNAQFVLWLEIKVINW